MSPAALKRALDPAYIGSPFAQPFQFFDGDASTPMDLTGRAVVLFLDRQGLPDAHHEIAGTVQTEGRVLFSVADTSDWIKGDYTLEVRLDGASVVVGRIAVAKGAAANGSDMVGAAQPPTAPGVVIAGTSVVQVVSVAPSAATDPSAIILPPDLSTALGGAQTLADALLWLAQNGGTPSPILRDLIGNVVISSVATGALSVTAAAQVLLSGAISSASSATGSLTVGAASSIALVGTAVSTSSLTGAMTVVMQIALTGAASGSSAVAGSLTVTTDVIGGMAVGQAGPGGTIYAGKVLADGDDFNTTTAADFLNPASNAGAYMTTRHYGVQSDAPRYLRGAASLGGYEADPFHTGFRNANRGVPLPSYADLITFGGGTLKTKTRIASAQEKAVAGPLASKNLVSSMVHMARRNMMRAPLLMEMRLRFPYAIASWNSNHPTFWLLQSQPGNGHDGLELDCEGFSAALQFNRNTWNNGVGQFGPTLGSTAPVSKTAFRTYAFEIVQEGGVWVVKLFEDGALVASGSPDYGGNTFDPTRPFHLMMTSHALQNGESLPVWEAAGAAGAEMECDWWRAWAPAGGVYRKPLVGAGQYLTDFATAFSFNLPTPAEVWGAGVTSDVIEMIPNEDNSPAQPWVRGLLPASVTRTGNTLVGTISDQPGRLILARSYTPALGDGCRPQPVTICVGPRIPVSAIDYQVGVAFSYDLYAQCDFGDLFNGATVGVTGLPAWATYSPATGLITGTPTDTGTSALTVMAVNAVGQQVVKAVSLQKQAVIVSYVFDPANTAKLVDAAGVFQYWEVDGGTGRFLTGGSNRPTVITNGGVTGDKRVLQFATNNWLASLASGATPLTAIINLFDGDPATGDRTIVAAIRFRPGVTSRGIGWGSGITTAIGVGMRQTAANRGVSVTNKAGSNVFATTTAGLDGNWHVITVVKTGPQLVLRIDGVQIATTTIGSDSAWDTTAVYLGASHGEHSAGTPNPPAEHGGLIIAAGALVGAALTAAEAQVAATAGITLP